MLTTNDMILALPTKGTNWRPLLSQLIENYTAEYAAAYNGAKPSGRNTVAVWNAASTAREFRAAAMQAAEFAVAISAQRRSLTAALAKISEIIKNHA